MEESKVTINYIDPDAFYNDMLEFREKRKVDPTFRIPNHIAEYIMLICKNVPKTGKFVKFRPIRSEMTSQAIENCIRYIDNWDPEHGRPFGYFSTIAFYACLKVIGNEKFEYLKRHELARRIGVETLFEEALRTGGDNLEAVEESMFNSFGGRMIDREMTFGVKEEWPEEPTRKMRRKIKKANEDVELPIDLDDEPKEKKKKVTGKVKPVLGYDAMEEMFE